MKNLIRKSLVIATLFVAFVVKANSTESTSTLKASGIESINFNGVNPSIWIKNDKVFVSRFALENQTMKITVIDSDSNVIYNEKLSGKINLGKVLNFSKLEDGTYKLVIKNDGKVFEKHIKKEKGNLYSFN